MLTDILYIATLFIAAFFGVMNFKKCSNAFRLLAVFLVITFLKETAGTVMNYMHLNNSLLQNLYTPVHAGCFAGIYFFLIKNKQFKKAIQITGSIITSIIMVGILSSLMNRLPWIFISIDAAMLLFFAILLFLDQMDNFSTGFIRSGSTWLNISVVVYFTATFIFWISYNYIIKQSSYVSNTLFYILDQLGTLHYFLILIAILLHVKENKEITGD